ncbi:MAG: sugar ABC transporter ATP-binding protein, partial [Dehalococcoidia bacterium]
SGRIFIKGKEVGYLNPERAQELGIGMVYQELSLIPCLSVAENIFLGQPPRNRIGMVDWPAMYKRGKEALTELGVDIDPRVEVRRLSVAEQQLTEIARILTKRTRILLLDEPTSALSDAERERLFDIIAQLRARGVSIVYISHRLVEVPRVGQRVTVLRDGKRIGTVPVEDADENTLVSMMVGRQITEQFPKHTLKTGEPILRVENLSLDGLLDDISFELHEGEILGIFGLLGAGQTHLARAIFGLESESTGRIYINGQKINIRHPADAIRYGLGYLTRDRREGLVPMLPLPPNVTLARVSQAPLLGLLRLNKEAEVTARYVRDLRIQTPSLDRLVVYLSGGNQQKVVLARWLASNSTVLIFDEPTRGIDVGAKAEVFALMDQLTQGGVGIIMISSEMPEILAMADRILVMRGGRFTAEYRRGEATQELLLRGAS